MNPKDQLYIYNHGFPGKNSTFIKEQIKNLPLADVDLVILIIGTNDTLNSNALNSLEIYEENLKGIINKIQENHFLLISTLLPFYEKYLMKRHLLEEYGELPPKTRLLQANRLIKKLADEFSIPLIDLYATFLTNGKIGEDSSSLIRNESNSGDLDGVHPTATGYKIIASVIYSALIKNNLPLNHILCLGDSITYGVHVVGEGETEGENYPGHLRKILESYL